MGLRKEGRKEVSKDGWMDEREEKKESLWFGCVQGKVNNVKELLLFFLF